MEFSIKTQAPERRKDRLPGARACYAGRNSRRRARGASTRQPTARCASALAGDLAGKAGSTLLLRGLPGVAAERVLLVRPGRAQELRTSPRSATRCAAAAHALKGLGATDAALPVADLAVGGRGLRLDRAPRGARHARGVLPLRPAEDAEESRRARARARDAARSPARR